MANLSNINNILRVSSSGVGINKNNTGPSELDIESAGADMIDMTRTGQKTYRFAISGASAFSLFDVAANADRLVIDSSGNSTFGGNVTVGNSGNINIPTASSGNANLHFDGTDFKITSNSSSANLKLETSSTTRLTINSVGNATFAKAVTIANISGSQTSPETQLLFDNNNIDDSGGYNIDFKSSSNDTANRFMSRIQALRTTSAKSSLGFFTESGSALTRALLLDDSQNATFSGNVTFGGALNGTTGNFTGNVAVNGTIIGSDQTFGNPYRTFAFGSNANGYNRIFAATNTTDGIYINAATGNGVRFRVNGGGSNVMVIDSSGNVGIGTTSPRPVGSGYTALEVSNPSSGSSIWLSGFTDSTKGYLAMDTGGLNLTAISNHPLTFGTNNSPKMTILSGGNVGIGTTSPNAKLHVNGSVHFGTDSAVINPTSGQLLLETTAGNSTSLLMYTYGSSIFQIQSQGTIAQIGWSSGQPRTVNFTNSGAGSISVGIGTTSPSSTLTVYGGGSTTSTLELRGGATGADNATISTQQSMAFQVGSAGATGRSFTFLKNGLGYSDGTALFSIDSNGGTFNRLWPQTATSGSSSVVQTTLIPEPGIYEYYLQGNPNAAGSAAYRSLQAGLITIAVDYTFAKSVFLRITKHVTAQDGGGSSNIQLNLNVYMLYNGSASDEQSIANKDQSVIYLTVSGYAGTVGSGQILRLTRKV